MMRIIQCMIYFGLYFILLLGLVDARPPSGTNDSNQQEVDTLELSQWEGLPRTHYADLPSRSSYQGVPLEKLQMLYDLGRRSAYRQYTPSLMGMDDLYRSPESKRQVRYRQCYFNPISCFRK